MAAKLDIAWVKNRVADELGLTEDDLAHLYGVEVRALDKHLATFGKDNQSVYERILSDVDAARIGYRQIEVNDDQISALRQILGRYRFHPLVSIPTADGVVGWRLSGDDAQYVAFRAADIAQFDFDWGEALRLRLNRAILWPDEHKPDTNNEFRDRVADVTFYLMELSGIL